MFCDFIDIFANFLSIRRGGKGCLIFILGYAIV
nr:MAG TPA: hypothetical protein [Caudoviricetes sp.]